MPMDPMHEEILKISIERLNLLTSNLPPYGATEQLSDFVSVNNELYMLKPMIDKAIVINNQVMLPSQLSTKFNEAVAEFHSILQSFHSIRNLSGYEPSFEGIYQRVHNFFERFFSFGHNYLTVFNSILSFDDFLNQQSALETAKLKEQLESQIARVEDLLKKLENPTAEKVVSDYARIYQRQERKAFHASILWVLSACGSIVFLGLILFHSLTNNSFPSTLTLTTNLNGRITTSEIINIPIMISKLTFVSLIVYFIFFCTKQYSIYSHLTIQNQQKKNAFESFSLFDAALGNADANARQILLTKLVAIVYESSQTGFLTAKEADVPMDKIIDAVSKLRT